MGLSCHGCEVWWETPFWEPGGLVGYAVCSVFWGGEYTMSQVCRGTGTQP